MNHELSNPEYAGRGIGPTRIEEPPIDILAVKPVCKIGTEMQRNAEVTKLQEQYRGAPRS